MTAKVYFCITYECDPYILLGPEPLLFHLVNLPTQQLHTICHITQMWAAMKQLYVGEILIKYCC